MSTVGTLAQEIRSARWASGAPTSHPASAVCAPLPGVAGLLLAYVQPVRDWYDELLGDAAEISATAATWERSSSTLRTASGDVVVAKAELADLDGRVVRALRDRYDDLRGTADDAAEAVAATAAALVLASRIITAARGYVCDVLVQLSRIAHDLVQPTLLPWELADRIADFADAVADLVTAVGALIRDVVDALGALGDLLSRLAPILGRELAGLREVVARMLPGTGAVVGVTVGGPLGGLVGSVFGGVLEDYLQTTPRVREVDPGELSIESRRAWEESQRVTELASLADLVAVNGTTDAIGGADATAIDVKEVVSADGSTHWVVSLPSTQDWELSGDAGADNDRDSNVTLMTDNALLRGVYERIALQTMAEAGIPPGADVVLTGFSQGGILAASLASDPRFPYNPTAVVTNGSPIDSFAVPPDVPVYAFQHLTDPVPVLDGQYFAPPSPNVHQILLADPAEAHGFDAHDNPRYVESVARWEQAYAEANGGPPPIDALVGEVVDHQVFTTAP